MNEYYSDQRPAAHEAWSSQSLAAEEQRLRKAHYSKKTAQNLAAAGLIESAPPDSRDDATHNEKRKKSVAFQVRVREESSGPRPQPQDTQGHHRRLNLDHNVAGPFEVINPERHPAHNRQHTKSDSAIHFVPNRSKLKELHHDEMLAAKGVTRRERTFIGHRCAACDEPLEHMLRGERILQLSCGHVSHEACFYEYIKEFEVQTCPQCEKPLGLDTSRGGNIDFGNLNKLARNVQSPDLRDRPRDRETTTPVPWEADATAQHTPHRPGRDHLLPEQVLQSNHRYDQSISASHARNGSNETGAVSSNAYSDPAHNGGRRHEYDVQSMEAVVNAQPSITRNPIPPPLVTVRSEFPTIGKSRHQQSLTCLVTVEVVEGKWQPAADELRSPTQAPPPPPPLPPPPPPTSEARWTNSARTVPRSATVERPVDSIHEDMVLKDVKEDLFRRVEDWHGLEFEGFGKLLLHGTVHVGKDRQTWQELQCYLFGEMLICVKERRVHPNASQQWDSLHGPQSKNRCALKGSILIKRHLDRIQTSTEDNTLTLSLSVVELPAFHLRFSRRTDLETWRKALANINEPEPPPPKVDFGHDDLVSEGDDYAQQYARRLSSVYSSSHGAQRSQGTAPTEYTSPAGVQDIRLGTSSLHIPLDIVVVVPVSSSMHGLKMSLLREALKFLVSSLGERDRMGLVTFGSGTGGAPVVGMTTKTWRGWVSALELLRPGNQKVARSDVVDGANVAVDLLMQRKTSNPLSHVLLISDSASSDPESLDFVTSRAEAAKISIHSFGLGLTHKPDTMVEMSTATKASYTYVKDWMMLRECLAGCIGALQSTSHQSVKLRLRLPEGSPAKFVKISGALHVTKRSTGRDAEVSLGDLRFGDRRDILVQLTIQSDSATPDSVPSDPWENIISGLEALGPMDAEDMRTLSVEELPLLQADLAWSDLLREGSMAQLPRPSLLAITMVPSSTKKAMGRPLTPPIPPHPSVVQRRMELLTSDMLSRALNLVSKGQNDRAQRLLAETRSILKGLGKGGLPPLPSPPPTGALPPTPKAVELRVSPLDAPFPRPPGQRTPSPTTSPDSASPWTPGAGIDKATMNALDSELASSLEWISHPSVFGRDSRKAVLQAIGVISSQRGFTFRTPSESLWAARIPGVRRLAERSRDWRDSTDESLVRES